MSKMHIAVSIGVLCIIGISMWTLFPRPTMSPTVNTDSQTATSSDVTVTEKEEPVPVVKKKAQSSLSVAPGDSITSWDFVGAYNNQPERIIEAQVEIARLSALSATTTFSKVLLLVGIANNYELLGDGKKQYEYLEKAIQTDVNEGMALPWHNLGVLMERLGALETARIAYEKATHIQPWLAQWHYAYLDFLMRRMKNDTVDIEKAFSWGEKSIGKDSYLQELRVSWQAS